VEENKILNIRCTDSCKKLEFAVKLMKIQVGLEILIPVPGIQFNLLNLKSYATQYPTGAGTQGPSSLRANCSEMK
jgi:hypothetical protein